MFWGAMPVSGANLALSLLLSAAVMAAGLPADCAGGQGAPLPGPTSAQPARMPIEIGPALGEIQRFQSEGWVGGETVVQPADNFGADDAQLALREFHVKALVWRAFQRGQRRIILKLYKFETPQGAYGAYTFLRRGATTVVRRGDASSEDDQSLSFWQDDCFVCVSTTAEEDDEAKDMMRQLSNRIAATVQRRSALPAIVTYLPQLDRIGGSEKLIMGPIVARRILSIPYLNVLDLGQCAGAASADYQFQEPTPERLKLLVIDYGNSQTAAQSYRRYCSTLEDSHEAVSSGTTALFKIQKTYLLCQLRGRLVAVISGARRRHSPAYLARQLDLLRPN